MWISLGACPPSTSLLTPAASSRYDDRRRLSTAPSYRVIVELADGFCSSFPLLREPDLPGRRLRLIEGDEGRQPGLDWIDVDDPFILKRQGRGDERAERHLRRRRRLQLDDARPAARELPGLRPGVRGHRRDRAADPGRSRRAVLAPAARHRADADTGTVVGNTIEGALYARWNVCRIGLRPVRCGGRSAGSLGNDPRDRGDRRARIRDHRGGER